MVLPIITIITWCAPLYLNTNRDIAMLQSEKAKRIAPEKKKYYLIVTRFRPLSRLTRLCFPLNMRVFIEGWRGAICALTMAKKEVLVGQALKLFEFCTKSDQPGYSSLISLEFMMERTWYVNILKIWYPTVTNLKVLPQYYPWIWSSDISTNLI